MQITGIVDTVLMNKDTFIALPALPVAILFLTWYLLKIDLTLRFKFTLSSTNSCWRGKKQSTIWYLLQTNPINWCNFKRLFDLKQPLSAKCKYPETTDDSLLNEKQLLNE